MIPGDDVMHSTVYAIAFDGEDFLMAWHPKRKGWEMPGGSIEVGETPEQAAIREFHEEAGYDIEVVATRDIGTCYVCAAILGPRIADDNEMVTSMFSTIPDELSFDRQEYEDTVPWARSMIIDGKHCT